jgi:hypothetical protein
MPLMLIETKQLEVFADYHQFYLWDSAMKPEAPESYTDDDVRRRIKTGPNVVVIQTERDLDVPVTIEIHDSEPGVDVNAWDHVAEASLHLPCGHLQVHECTGGPIADFKVAPGWYRVRSMHGGFETIAPIGADGNDFYKVLLWPADAAEVAVLKQWAA